MKQLTNTIFLALVCFSFTLFAQTEDVLLTDMLKIKTAQNPSFSPDKKQILYQITGIRPTKENVNEFENYSQLMVYSHSDKSTKAITDDKKSVSAAQFSPDGKYISFIRSESGKSALYLMDRSGGEPIAIGNPTYPVQAYEWDKKGKVIYYFSSISLDKLVNDSILNPKKSIPYLFLEKPGFKTNAHWLKSTTKANPNGTLEEIRAYLAKNELDKKAKVFNKLNFQEETTTNSDVKITVLFRMLLEHSNKVEMVSPLYDNLLDFQVNAAGTKIYGIRSVRKPIHPDKVQDTELVELNLNDATVRVLKSKEGVRYDNLLLSPNEETLIYSESNVGEVKNASYFLTTIGDFDHSVKLPIDRVVTQMKYSDDSKMVYFTIQDHGGVPLLGYQLSTGTIKEIRPSVAEGILSFDEQEGQFVFTKTAINNPMEVFLWDGSQEKQLSNLNADWLKNKRISIPEKHTFTNDKGQVVDYWVMKPKGFDPSKKFPLLLEIHGGPTAMWGTGELSMWHEFQYFASKGYGVVYANPRGSGGYGSAFMAANVKDWGKGPMDDVMKAMDLTIKEGWADTTKLAVTGGSYAGYLVSYMLGHTNRFKVACAQRGVYELSTFFGEGNAWRLVPNYFGGFPWDKNTKQLLDKESPLTYVKNIKTPLIIFHGEVDLRTGVIQSEMLYKSLKVLNREVEYVRHPGASHEITRAGDHRQRMDQMLRTYEYFSRFIP